MDYELYKEQNFPSGSIPRTIWRIIVPRGLKPNILEKMVENAARDAFEKGVEHGTPPGAIRVFAFTRDGDDYDETPTAGTGTLSPDGSWGRVESVPQSVDELVFEFKMAEIDLEPSVHPCKAGDIVSVGTEPAHLSETAEDWSEPFAQVPPGTDVKVLDVKLYTAAGKARYFRVKVLFDGKEGWTDDTSLDLKLGDLS